MTHIPMNDGSILLQLPSGVQTINPKTLYYHRIVIALSNDDDALVLELLNTQADDPVYLYIIDNKPQVVSIVAENIGNFPQDCFVGTYANKQEVMEDYPELFI